MLFSRAVLADWSEIKLSDTGEVPSSIQVLRVGKFKHPKYGDFEITTATLSEMIENFNGRVRGIDVGFDYFHKSDEEAAGWPKKLRLSDDGQSLWADDVEWTPRAHRMLAEKEVKYFSPDFAFRWKDPESGKTFNNVLFGGGLTNRPFVKEMAAIVAAEENEMTLVELQNQNKKLSEDLDAANADKKKLGEDSASKIAALEADIAEKMKQLEALKSENSALMGEKKQLEEAKVLAEKEGKFNVLLSEGKACAAQKDAFMKGDMEGFIKLAESPNLKGTGTGAGSGEGGGGDLEERVLKLAEEKRKADPALEVGDAISLAMTELSKK